MAKDFQRDGKPFRGKGVFSTNGAGELDMHRQWNELTLHHTLHLQINSKCIEDLTELLEENQGVSGMTVDLAIISFVTPTDKLKFLKIKNICVNGVKR